MMKTTVLLCLSSALTLNGCNVYRFCDDFKNFSIKEVIYFHEKRAIRITNSIDIEEFFRIISKAKKVKSKFISLENFELILADGSKVLMNRSHEFIRINGVSYILSNKNNETLTSFINKIIC